MISYKITLDLEPPMSPVSGGEGQQTGNPGWQPEAPKKVEQPREFKQLKKTYRAPKGSPPVRSRGKATQQLAQLAQPTQLEVTEQ